MSDVIAELHRRARELASDTEPVVEPEPVIPSEPAALVLDSTEPTIDIVAADDQPTEPIPVAADNPELRQAVAQMLAYSSAWGVERRNGDERLRQLVLNVEQKRLNGTIPLQAAAATQPEAPAGIPLSAAIAESEQQVERLSAVLEQTGAMEDAEALDIAQRNLQILKLRQAASEHVQSEGA